MPRKPKQTTAVEVLRPDMVNDPPHRGRGRPPTFSQEKTNTILNWLKVGSYLETAAAAAGINRDTLRRWIRHGTKDRDAGTKTDYADFAADIEQATALGELHDLGLIAQAADSGLWQAAAWKLERKFPDKYGRRDYVDASITLRKQVEQLARKTGIPEEELWPEVERAYKELD